MEPFLQQVKVEIIPFVDQYKNLKNSICHSHLILTDLTRLLENMDFKATCHIPQYYFTDIQAFC